MTSIPTSPAATTAAYPPPAPTPTTPGAKPGAAKAAKAEEGALSTGEEPAAEEAAQSDFTALIDAFRQLVAAAPEAAEASGTDLTAPGEDNDAPADDEAGADEMLAALGLAQMLPFQAPPPPLQPAGGGALADGGLDGLQLAAGGASAGGIADVAETLLDAVGDGQDVADTSSLDGKDGSWATAVQRTVAAQDAAARAQPVAAENAVHETVGSARWQEELGAKLTMMSVQGQHKGVLQLNPEHLGPLEVQISVNGDTADLQFGAQNPETRAALQDALPRLREMFSTSGMTLGDAAVSQEAPRQRNEAAIFRGSGLSSEGEAPASVTSVRPITHRGLLDLYA